MTDLASLGIEVDSRGYLKAARDADTFVASGARAETSVKKVTRATDLLNASLLGVARAAGVMVAGLVSFQALQAATRYTLGFRSALSEVSTLIEGTPAQMDRLEKSSRRLARQFGTDAKMQVQGFYDAISAGAGTVSEAEQILDAANRLAVGGATTVSRRVLWQTRLTDASTQPLSPAESPTRVLMNLEKSSPWDRICSLE